MSKNNPSVLKINPDQKVKISINDKRLREFSRLLSTGMSREEIQKEMKIKNATYYKYYAATEQVVENFLLAIVDYGLVLQFMDCFDRVLKRREDHDLAISIARKMATKDPLVLIKCLKAADENDTLISNYLDDAKIVNQVMKILHKKSVSDIINDNKPQLPYSF